MLSQDTGRSIRQLEKLLEISNTTFSAERHTKLEKLYEHFAERIIIAPASGFAHYHNCYGGGYIDHVHNVIQAAGQVTVIFNKLGGVIDYSKEELIFAAMHHDLGKLGDLTEPYYLPQTSDWHRENRGEYYKINPNLPFMKVPERALWLLQHFGVTVTDKEQYGIRLSDGLFDESNKPYFIRYGYPAPKFFTNLHLVIHWADHMAATMERNQWEQGKQ